MSAAASQLYDRDSAREEAQSIPDETGQSAPAEPFDSGNAT